MIFLDTNAAIELFNRDSESESDWLARLYRDAAEDVELVCNLIVVAEVAAGLDHAEQVPADFARLDIAVIDLPVDAALRAARAFRDYRRRGGPRSTMLPDFLIAAHAAVLGAALATRDRRLASYFPELTFLTPETDNG